jgi:hypothetical protein
MDMSSRKVTVRMLPPVPPSGETEFRVTAARVGLSDEASNGDVAEFTEGADSSVRSRNEKASRRVRG